MIDKIKIEEARSLAKVLSEELGWLKMDYSFAFADLNIEEPSEDVRVVQDLERIASLIGKLNETLSL